MATTTHKTTSRRVTYLFHPLLPAELPSVLFTVVQYHLDWIDCAENTWNFTVDFMGS